MYTAAIIGVSGYGATHFEDLTERYPKDSIKIIGATIINQPDEIEKCNYLRSQSCEIFTDYREMFKKLNGKLDLCCIPTGINSHKDITVAALEAGANVFVEKPLCATIQDAKAIKKAELKSGKFVIVGYQHIAQPSVIALKKILLSGQLGTIKRLKYMCPSCRLKSYYFRNGWAGKISLPNGDWVLDSPFNNANAHTLNLILYLAGNSFETSAQLKNITAELYRAKEYIKNADTGFMRMETIDGKELFYIASHSYNGSATDMLIECTNGTITLNDNHYVISYANGKKETMPAVLCRKPVVQTIYNKLQNPNVFSCCIDIAIAQTTAMNGAHESSEIIKIPKEFTETFNKNEENEVTVIKDLKKTITDCYDKNLLPSELGIAWAKAGELFDLSNYQEFMGGKIQKCALSK